MKIIVNTNLKGLMIFLLLTHAFDTICFQGKIQMIYLQKKLKKH